MKMNNSIFICIWALAYALLACLESATRFNLQLNGKTYPITAKTHHRVDTTIVSLKYYVAPLVCRA